jgi:peptide/nickel transport system ATP-binding protein
MTTPKERSPVSDGAPPAAAANPLFRAQGLTKHFRLGGLLSKRLLHAVDDVDLDIGERQIVALVGESGSGKSTMARLAAMVYAPTAGEIRFEGVPLSRLQSRAEVLAYRGKVPMVFQDPYSSLNPSYRAAHGIMRGLRLHRPDLDRRGRVGEAERVLEAVGLVPTRAFLDKYPHELSGGQRQRFGFAQALAYRPRLILADEPVSMLDVSIRIGLLNLMADLRRDQGVSFLYITHDIASARYIADRVVVMYAGHVVEQGPTERLMAEPRHPYMQLLLSAVPDPRAPLSSLSASDVGEPPRVIDPGEGCRFRWRCPHAMEVCSSVTPRLRPVGPDHLAACHLEVPVSLGQSGPVPDRHEGSTATSNGSAAETVHVDLRPRR